MKKLIFVMLIFFSLLSVSNAQQMSAADQKTYHDEFLKYAELMQVREMYKTLIPQLMVNFKEGLGEKVPESYWMAMEKEFLGKEVDTLLEKLIPVYMKHLSLADLKELNKFLSSPSGKAFVNAQTAVQVESNEIGDNWGKSLTEKIVAKLERDGYTK